MKNNLLKNLMAATVIIFTVGVGGVWAQEVKSNLPECKGTDTKKWDRCFGTVDRKKEEGWISKGEFRNGSLNGQGELYFKGGVFKGNFENDAAAGKGETVYINGNKYIGEYKNNFFYGQGIYLFSNRNKFYGEWKDNKRNGYGELLYNNGDMYVGWYKDDKWNGRGIFTYANGDNYIGEWKDGEYNGEGVLTFSDGRKIEGIWENDKFVREIKTNIPNIIINDIKNINKKIDNKHIQLQEELKKFEEEKRNREQARNKQRFNLQVTSTQPNAEGDFVINIQTGSDTASLKINGEEQGGKQDGIYSIKRVARAGQATQFTILAKDIYGNTDSKTFSVTRQVTASNQIKYTELNPALVKTQPSKDAVAIIIGIADYKNLPRADFANEDARIFYDYAIRGLGVRAENIKLLVDADAGQGEILKTFKTWLPARVKPTTDVYVYYSGHGLPSADGQTLYILPQLADRDLIEDTAVAQSRINAAIQAAKPKSVTIFLDSCYSGAARTGQTLLASARPISLKANTTTFPSDFTVFTASTAEQISSSSNELKHGIFSYYLMRGMEGEADTNKDGKITAGEMHSYLMDNVTRQASLANRVQQPQLAGDANRVLVGR